MEGGSWSAALKAGAESLVTSAVMFEVGTLANGVVGAPPKSWVSAIELKPGQAIGGDLGRALMHGVAQGAINVAEGKKFTIGFETAFVSCALAPISQVADTMTNSDAAGDVVAGAVGGLASKMGGGKFEDGFVTGALFQHFNEDAHKTTWVDKAYGLYGAASLVNDGYRSLKYFNDLMNYHRWVDLFGVGTDGAELLGLEAPSARGFVLSAAFKSVGAAGFEGTAQALEVGAGAVEIGLGEVALGVFSAPVAVPVTIAYQLYEHRSEWTVHPSTPWQNFKGNMPF